jgi:Protein of unknown function (DUF3800)
MGTPSFDLYLDDSGTRFPDRAPQQNRDDGIDCFSLGGILVKSEDVSSLIAMMNEFKKRNEIAYPLHSHKIRTKKGDFLWLKTDAERARNFYADLNELIQNIPGYVVGCCVHRPGYNNRYAAKYAHQPWEMCKSAYTIVVERAAKFALMHGRKLVVYVEETGKCEDRAIRSYHDSLRSQGMYFDAENSAKYAPLAADGFASVLMKNPKFVKKDNVGAQMADIVLYPVVKGGYDPTYCPYQSLVAAKKLIDCALTEEEAKVMGIKYFCFDGFKTVLESEKASV